MWKLYDSLSAADPCVFIRVDDSITIIAVYVDDLTLMTSKLDQMRQLKQNLAA